MMDSFVMLKFNREIPSQRNILLSTVSGITTSDRPRKITEWGQRMLMCIVCRGCQLSAELMAKDLQTSGRQISSGIYSIKPHSRFMITVTIKNLFFFSLLFQFLINQLVMSSNDAPSISSPLLSYPVFSYTTTASH